jgi:hypothetical protein
MQMVFEVGDDEKFAEVQLRLTSECVAWAERFGHDLDPVVVGVLLETKRAQDGRIADWDHTDVNKMMFEYLPCGRLFYQDIELLPVTFQLLLEFLDYRGELIGEICGLAIAIIKNTREFFGHMLDENDGVLRKKLIEDRPVFDQNVAYFDQRISVDRDDYDSRSSVFLPISLPPQEELSASASTCLVVQRLRDFMQWVDSGKSCTWDVRTRDAEFSLDDHAELVRLLGSQREATLAIDDANQLWLCRIHRGKYLPIKKNQWKLAEPLEAWRSVLHSVRGAAITYLQERDSCAYHGALCAVTENLGCAFHCTIYALGETEIAVEELADLLSHKHSQRTFNRKERQWTEKQRYAQWRKDYLVVFECLADLGAMEFSADRAQIKLTPLGLWGFNQLVNGWARTRAPVLA